MNLTPPIKNAHEKLSKCSLQFLEYVNRNPEALKADNYRKLELNDPLFQLQPWPTFINQQTKNEMKEASIKVVNLIKSIPKRIFSHDYKKISSYYGIPLNLVHYFLDGFSSEDIDILLARGDFILSRTGLKCLEFNINANLGGLQLPFWQSLYLNTPIISGFLTGNNVRIRSSNLISDLLEHLLQSARNRFPAEKEEINIVIAFPIQAGSMELSSWQGYYNSLYINLLKKHGLRGEVIICEYSRLNVENGYVFYEGKQVHSIMEWYQGFVPGEILEVFKAGNILIFNGAVAFLLSSKLNMALLSESEDAEILDSEERDVIRKYIPWTRKVSGGESTYESEKIDLPSFILDNKDKLVLKPVLGFGGKDIYLGRYHTDSQWRDLVDLALKGEDWRDLQIGETVSQLQWNKLIEKAVSVKSWVVQEYIEPASYLYQWGENGCAHHHVIWGYYIFGNRYAGSWVRVLPEEHVKGPINCHQGAKVSVVFEVDET